MDYEKTRNIAEELAGIAKKYNIIIVSAAQLPLRKGGLRKRLKNKDDILIIDYIDLLKPKEDEDDYKEKEANDL